MKILVFVACLLIVYVAAQIEEYPDLTGSSLYSKLVEDWSYAYTIASDVSITYNTTTNYTLQSKSVELMHGIDIDWTAAGDTDQYIAPITGFPIVIGYNIALINGTLLLTRELLLKMVTNTTMRWNDPDLLALNPSLSRVTATVRILFDKNPSTINKLIIDYLYGHNQTLNNTGYWQDIAAGKHVLVDGYSAVVSGLSVSSNSMAFFPYPIIKSYQSSGAISLAEIEDINVVARHTDDISLDIAEGTSSSILSAEGSTSNWPLRVFGYLVYDQSIMECTEAIEILRFFYWKVNNTHLASRTKDNGFYTFDDISHDTIKSFLLTAKCQGSTDVLYYTNLSDSKRSTFIFVVSCVFTALFVGLVMSAWMITDKRYRFVFGTIFSRCVVLVGLMLSFAAYVLWWYPPSSDAICKGRTWLLNLGFTNVVTAVFMYSVIRSLGAKAKKLGRGDGLPPHIIVAFYVAFEVMEIIVLLIWTEGEGMTSRQVDVDPILWTRVYECSSSTGYADLLQLIYYCCISLFGLFVIFKRYDPKSMSQEDSRWLLMALYCQILLFVILMILTRINVWDDDTLYPVYVSFYLLTISMVIFAFFLPEIIRTLKKIAKSGSDNSSKEKSSTSADNKLARTQSAYELERKSSARTLSIEMSPPTNKIEVEASTS